MHFFKRKSPPFTYSTCFQDIDLKGLKYAAAMHLCSALKSVLADAGSARVRQQAKKHWDRSAHRRRLHLNKLMLSNLKAIW